MPASSAQLATSASISTILAENNNKIFCKACYGKQFGPKGYGFAGGSSFLTTGIYSDIGEAEKPKSESKSSSQCTSPSSSLPTPTRTSSFLPESYPPKPPRTDSLEYSNNLRALPEIIEQPISTHSLSDNFITRNICVPPKPRRFHVEQEKCLRCKKSVYAAEMVIGCGGKYHQNCFRCIDCSKSLNSTNMTEHDGELYCKGCYSREFGPKGYGFANGAAFLTSNGVV
ncbi:hypothetical protein DSO57_1022346 [Entomophthora muscae]|uniref:Uncharacterized protein n=1 Tax=Entomophthora muscae TaxID=34485 RepID=A0ACC2U279_9FUNG|nr:hypothetical protein DSO57_1022346 [Entomophthora muscae]